MLVINLENKLKNYLNMDLVKLFVLMMTVVTESYLDRNWEWKSVFLLLECDGNKCVMENYVLLLIYLENKSKSNLNLNLVWYLVEN